MCKRMDMKKREHIVQYQEQVNTKLVLQLMLPGGDGSCAAEDCFGGTAEAKWLQENVADYGFIIRYPKGKDAITGYKYEPWHLRYVGKTIASDIMNRGITLEEYFNAIPVNN